jgi:phosphate-selective porin
MIHQTGNLAEPTSLLLTTTSVTDVLAFAAGDSGAFTVGSIKIVNQDTTDRKVTVWWTKDSTDYRLFEAIVGANSTIDAVDQPFKLVPKLTARKIRAQAATANVITVNVIYTEGTQSIPNALG